jgi:DNA modification methylase
VNETENGTERTQHHLYYGDAVATVRNSISDDSVDLVYLDPTMPSLTTASSVQESPPPSSVQSRGSKQYSHLPTRLYIALRPLVGDEEPLLSWLDSLFAIMTEAKRVLRASGSIFVQTDVTVSPYVRLLLDYVFGRDAFRNEIVWQHLRPYFSRSQFPITSTRLMFYAKSSERMFFSNEAAPDGRPITDLQDRHGVSLSKPKPLVDSEVWKVAGVSVAGSERLGYPGQDPVELLERIIVACTPEDAVILDPYCGTGTALVAASQTARRSIGIDHDYVAITLVKHRMADAGISPSSFRVHGDPVSKESAPVVARRDPRLFELWILGLLGARPALGRRRDRGFDGQLIRPVAGRDQPVRILIEVKARATRRDDVVMLQNALAQEGAELGLLVGLDETPIEVSEYSSSLPVVPIAGQRYPAIQVLSINDLSDGRRPALPTAKS